MNKNMFKSSKFYLSFYVCSLQNFVEYISRRKAENGGGYLTSRCAGGRGNTTHTPEAGEVKLQSPDSLGKMFSQLCSEF